MPMAYTDDFRNSLPGECLKLPEEFGEPDWLNDPANLPYTALADNKFVFQVEEDYMFAHRSRRGVMFDLWKQLYGCTFYETSQLYTEDGENVETLSVEELDEITTVTSTRTYKPNPAQYQLWAWSANALLQGNLEALNFRLTYNKNNLDGGDITKIVNKLGFWGLDNEINRSKRLSLARFAPLYARMFNNDPRYTSYFPCIKQLKEDEKLENDFAIPSSAFAFRINKSGANELLTKERESPLKYCTECFSITDVWASRVIKRGDKDYDKYFEKVKQQEARQRLERHAKPCQARYAEDTYKFVGIGCVPKA